MSENIICLGKTFTSEDERREYFREELRKKLPELKKIDGFPIGEDEDIIALSDPPYYTTCPNPWLNDFIEEWEKEKAQNLKRKQNFYVSEPYANDISEGKNNSIYTAHTYHTKVPHPAIMRYILHYTQPGDIVFDGFSGTGMSGVAAQICGDPDQESKYKIENEWKNSKNGIPNWGIRKAILGDLSPIASFITYNYNTPLCYEEFVKDANHILTNVENDFAWLYMTIHKQNKGKETFLEDCTNILKKIKSIEGIRTFYNSKKENFGKINYTVWSDVFICPECGNEIVFWDVAYDVNSSEVKDTFYCKSCKALNTKRSVSKAWITIYDQFLQKTIKQIKTVPVMINYSVGKKRYEKKPDLFDLGLLDFINKIEVPYWFPKDIIPNGYNTQQPMKSHGFTHVHHFYTKQSQIILSYLWFEAKNRKFHLFIITSLLSMRCTKRMPYREGGRSAGSVNNLSIPSLTQEYNVYETYQRKLKQIIASFNSFMKSRMSCIYCSSATQINIKSNSVDYIFTDPPFGANIMYSDMNYLWESWIKITTNNKTEAIENSAQSKGFLEYQELMLQCFKEYYRILKANKWMTVEFSNTSAVIWNGIQIALQRSGFVIANVSALDKKQGSFKAVTTTTAVKQDLIISCYKPSKEIVEKFNNENVENSVWDFVREHLMHLPIQIKNDEKRTTVVERSPRIIYDRLVTFYLMRGSQIPIDAGDFQIGLKQRFAERDNLYFTFEQVAEYDDVYNERSGDQYVFVFDTIYSESDAVLWLKERLMKNQETYQEIMPSFRKANHVIRKGELIVELKIILEENFIQEKDGKWRVPNMNELKDREVLRTKSLLREFSHYLEELNNAKTKRLKEVRVEALRAGFKMCWEKKDFQTIVSMGEKIPQNILLEDEQLLMYYDIAKDRI